MAENLITQRQAINGLIDDMKRLADGLRYHVITEPNNLLEEMLYHGLAPDIVHKYRYRFYEHDKDEAEKIIRYIDTECIPYLEAVRGDIENAIRRLG